jgi:hypothetical protein
MRRDIVEECSSINCNHIVRAARGRRVAGGLIMSEPIVTGAPRIGFHLELSELPTVRLFYFNDGSIRQQQVRLTRTVPYFGGERWWFVCPEIGLRVEKLYLTRGRGGFVSRRAAGLTYRSCRESGRFRAVLDLTARKLGVTPKEIWRELQLRRGRHRGR